MNTYSDGDLLAESTNLLELGYYSSAEKIIDKLLAKDPANNNYNYRKGFILCEGRNNYAKAIEHLEKAKGGVTKNYDAFSNKETGAPQDLYFYLARSYHREGNIEKARENYNEFLTTAVDKTDNKFFAEVALEQLDVATKFTQNPKKNTTIVNIGNVINTAEPEYSPVTSLDGSSLYFTSRRKWKKGKDNIELDPKMDFYPEDIYVSYRDNDDGTWSTPERLNFCNEEQNEASVAVSPSERKVYVYQDLVGNGNMFFSEFKNNRFGKIEDFPTSGVNTEEGWETHCYMTPDGRNMYFTSDRPGGFGGRDIYRIVKLPDGSWSQPFNLGEKINSRFDEDCPFMAIDNKTLYFASNGPNSMGGFDIFVTVVDEDNNWTDPINLGSPINSFDDDLFYTETIDGRKGFITSRRADSYGDKDIYEVHNDYLSVKSGYYLKGHITTKSGQPIPEDVTVGVNCLGCETDIHNVTAYPRMRDGSYIVNLQPCMEYEVIFAHNDGTTEFHRTNIKTTCDSLYQEIVRDAMIDVDIWAVVEPGGPDKPVDTIPTTTTTPKTFDPLAFKHNFSYNAAVLSTTEGDLAAFIGKVEQQLKDGKANVIISVYSSASKVPTKTFKTNTNLANARANNIKKELDNYFANSTFKGKVTVTIVSAVVGGPTYVNDKENEAKYVPYQFIELKTK